MFEQLTGQLHSLRGTIGLARFRLWHQRGVLDRAIRDLELAAAQLRDSHRDRPLNLAALSNALLWRYALTSDADDLDDAIDRLRAAISAPAVTMSDAATFGGDLAALLRARFVRDGDAADLDEAIDAATASIELGGEVDSAVTNRALALLARYEQTADLDDLLRALDDAGTPVRGPVRALLHRATRLGALADALSSRYQYTGDETDLAAAIEAARQALDALPRADPDRSLFAARLSEALRLSDEPAHLSEAVERATEAIRDSSDQSVDHAYLLSSLSMTLFMRHARTGDRDDLGRALDTATAALSTRTNRNRPMLLQRVAMIACRSFDVTGEQAALQQGESAIREALDATTPGDPIRAALVCELDDLRRRGPDSPERAATVLDLLISAVDQARGVLYLRFALRSATRLGEVGMETGRLDAAMAGYRRAVELLPSVAWPGLRRAVREARLADAPPATDAAAQAIRAADPHLAVELLESGRSLLWAQQLRMRTDLDRLRDVAPGLAQRMTDIRVRLEESGADGVG